MSASSASSSENKHSTSFGSEFEIVDTRCPVDLRNALLKNKANIDRQVTQINRRWTTSNLVDRSGRPTFDELPVMSQVDFIVGDWMLNEFVSPFQPLPCVVRFMSPAALDKTTSIIKAEFLESMREVRDLAVDGYEGEAERLLAERIGPKSRSATDPKASVPSIIRDDVPWGFRRSIECSYSTAGHVLESTLWLGLRPSHKEL
jgi:hypothetical protein